MPLVLSLDAGTGSVKAVLLEAAAGGWRCVARATCALEAPTSLEGKLSGGQEQDATGWWTAAVDAVRQVMLLMPAGARVDAIGLSGQMQSVVLVGADGECLRPAMLYSDVRASAEADELERAAQLDDLRFATPCCRSFRPSQYIGLASAQHSKR